jgi:RNA polymerase sigma factor (sigma-70 family)
MPGSGEPEDAMTEPILQRLSRISTSWSMLAKAHAAGDEATTARRLLCERYQGAVRRYAHAVIRDAAAAEDLTQEFALARVRGDFHGARPERGRFRDYVKGVVFNLVSQQRRRSRRQPGTLADELIADDASSPEEQSEQTFQESWRAELLARAWAALVDVQPEYFTVLHCKTAHPEFSSEQLAQALEPQLGRSISADATRQTLRRARRLYADLLLEQVAQSLDPPTQEDLAEELAELNLLEYCRPALERSKRRET